MRCSDHCPAEKSGAAAVAVLVLPAAAVAGALSQIESVIAALYAAAWVLLALSVPAGIWTVRRLNRRHRGAVRPAERAALEATRVQTALPARQPAALTAARVHVITDAAESRVVIERS